MSTPITYGPHLLGRIPSPEDERDWKLARFLTDDPTAAAAAELAAMDAELKKTTVGYINHSWKVPPAGTHWNSAYMHYAKVSAFLNPPPPPPPPPNPNVVEWVNPLTALNQGDFGTCVGNGNAQWGNTSPVNDKFTETDARSIYYKATILDGSPDDPDAPGGGQQGATTRSGIKVMQGMGRLTSYASADTTDDVTAWLQLHGPLVIGSDWLANMFNPNSSGLVAVTGAIEGGHCYLAVGVDLIKGLYKFLNSWGTDWGVNGYFYMKITDFAKLLNQGGEAWAAVELPL